MVQKLPMDWTERIFERLKCIFKEKWAETYEKNPGRKALYLEMWSTGLSGLTAKEIQRALLTFELSASHLPPTVMEFHHCAKGHIVLPRRKEEDMRGITTQVAKHHLQEIKTSLLRKTHIS